MSLLLETHNKPFIADVTHTDTKKKAGHLTHNATLKTATMSQTLETKYNFTALTNTVNPKIATLFKTDCQASFKKD